MEESAANAAPAISIVHTTISIRSRNSSTGIPGKRCTISSPISSPIKSSSAGGGGDDAVDASISNENLNIEKFASNDTLE